MADWLIYIFILFMAVGTSRMALSKGRNPWIWGGGALILGLPGGAVSLLSVVPLIVLMFLSASATEAPTKPERLACPKCTQTRRPTQHFCTNCGWELSQPYTPDGSETVTEVAQEAAAHQAEAPEKSPVEPVIAQTAEEPAVETQAPASAAPPVESESPPEVGSAEPEPAQAQAANTDESVASEEQEAAPEEPSKPWGMPEPVVAPTAAMMTARGIGRLNDGRIQEAIDQFTKAIALDPNYLEAWELRAEAYAKQGRGEEAAEDRRRIQGLNASSSPG